MRPDGDPDYDLDGARPTVLRVTSRRTGPRVVVALDGELDMAGAGMVLREVRHHLGSDVEVLEIDGAGLAFVDSVGLRALLSLQTEAGAKGVTYGVAASPHLTRLLRLTGLTDVLTLVG
jgi:anti-anti-sigma factor